MGNSIRINIFGDFVAPSLNNLKIESSLYEYIADADINTLNFEAPVHTTGKAIRKSGPNLSQSNDAPAWIEKNGFNLITISNNHFFDYGEIGYQQSINSFHKANIVGGGTWSSAYKPAIIEVQGKKIGFLSFTHCEFGTLTDAYDNRFSMGCGWINHPTVDKLIQEVRSIVDYLIILPHAGVEDIEQPLPEWRDRYQSFIDLGCDAVVASHTHVSQGWESYKEKLICYSLGNFYFNTGCKEIPSWYHSLCASISINPHGSLSYNILPIVFNEQSISIDNSEETKEYLDRVNKTLANNELYLSYVNKCCIDMLPVYLDLFSASGFVFPRFLNLLKQLIKVLMKRQYSNPTHLINNMRCESHRWCICRALKILNDIQ